MEQSKWRRYSDKDRNYDQLHSLTHIGELPGLYFEGTGFEYPLFTCYQAKILWVFNRSSRSETYLTYTCCFDTSLEEGPFIAFNCVSCYSVILSLLCLPKNKNWGSAIALLPARVCVCMCARARQHAHACPA